MSQRGKFRNFEGGSGVGGGGGGGGATPSPGSVPISDFWYGVLPMQINTNYNNYRQCSQCHVQP